MEEKIDPNALYTAKRASEILGFATVQGFMYHIMI